MTFVNAMAIRYFNPSFFVISLCVALTLSFASAFLAFGCDEVEFVTLTAKQIAYRVFLILRFPTHQIAVIRSFLPQIHHQLIVNSVFYAAMLTTIFSTAGSFNRR